jgi:squalene monooxygenase
MHVLIFNILLWLFSVQLEQGTVTSLLEENGIVKGVQYKTKSGEELKAFAPLTIVCDGCFSNLRRALCSPKVVFHIIFIVEFCDLWILIKICS